MKEDKEALSQDEILADTEDVENKERSAGTEEAGKQSETTDAKGRTKLQAFFERLKKGWSVFGSEVFPKWKRPLKRVGVPILLVGLAGLMAWGVYSFWDNEFNPRYAYEYRVDASYNICLQYPMHGERFLYNRATGEKTLMGIDLIYLPCDGDSLAVYFMKGRRGYFNRYTGLPVTDTLYDRAWVFSEGVAMTAVGDKLCLMDHKCNKLWQMPYYDEVRKRIDLDYVFHNGCCVMNDSLGQVGLIGLQGEWLLEPQFSDLRPMYIDGHAFYYSVLGEGSNECYGVVDNQGQVLVPCAYSDVEFSEGYLFASDSLHFQWCYELDGTLHPDPIYYNVTHLTYSYDMKDTYEDEYYSQRDLITYAALYRYTSSEDGYMGLMDSNGHRVTPPIYLSIKAINDNLYCCGYDNQFDHSVLLNAKGEVVK